MLAYVLVVVVLFVLFQRLRSIQLQLVALRDKIAVHEAVTEIKTTKPAEGRNVIAVSLSFAFPFNFLVPRQCNVWAL